jgi:hypothetical protein
MPKMIELKNGEVETLLTELDFARLIEKHMGYDAADYFLNILDTLDWYREGEFDDDDE